LNSNALSCFPLAAQSKTQYLWTFDVNQETCAVHSISLRVSAETLLVDLERFLGCAVEFIYGDFRPMWPVWQLHGTSGIRIEGFVSKPMYVFTMPLCLYRATEFAIALLRREPFTPEADLEAEIVLHCVQVEEIK